MHYETVENNLERGKLVIHYRQQTQNRGELMVFEPPGVHYLLPHIRMMGNPTTIHSIYREHQNIVRIRYQWNGEHSIQLPFYSTPVRYDQLPRNELLGRSIPPSVLWYDGNETCIYSNGSIFVHRLSLEAIAFTIAPDSTMRYDVITVGTVALLLFSLQFFKQTGRQ